MLKSPAPHLPKAHCVTGPSWTFQKDPEGRLQKTLLLVKVAASEAGPDPHVTPGPPEPASRWGELLGHTDQTTSRQALQPAGRRAEPEGLSEP